MKARALDQVWLNPSLVQSKLGSIQVCLNLHENGTRDDLLNATELAGEQGSGR